MFSITVMSSFRYLQCQAETFNLIQNFFKSLFRIKKGDASVFKVHILGMSLQIFHKDLIFYSIFNTFSIKRNSFSAVVSISVQYSVSDPFKETVDIISSDPLFKKNIMPDSQQCLLNLCQQLCERFRRFLVSKVFISDNFLHCFCKQKFSS